MKIGAMIAVPLLGLMKLGTRAEKETRKHVKQPERVRSRKRAQAQVISDLKPYRAVSLHAGKDACDVMAAINGRRFLVAAGDAPMLPLPGCDAARCNCRYAHHDDRREDKEDRRLMGSLQADLYETTGNANRRTKSRGRRQTDC